MACADNDLEGHDSSILIWRAVTPVSVASRQCYTVLRGLSRRPFNKIWQRNRLPAEVYSC